MQRKGNVHQLNNHNHTITSSTARQELVEECPAAKALFDQASAILGYDLLQVRDLGAARDLRSPRPRIGDLSSDVATTCSRGMLPAGRLMDLEHSAIVPPTCEAIACAESRSAVPLGAAERVSPSSPLSPVLAP